MSSHDGKKEHKKEHKKKHKKEHKEERKERKRSRSRSRSRSPSPKPGPAVATSASLAPPAAAVVPVPPAPGLSAEDKRKLLGAGRGARKQAYTAADLSGMDARSAGKFSKFLGIAATPPPAGAAPRVDGKALEEDLAKQFERGRAYQFGGAKGRGLGGDK